MVFVAQTLPDHDPAFWGWSEAPCPEPWVLQKVRRESDERMEGKAMITANHFIPDGSLFQSHLGGFLYKLVGNTYSEKDIIRKFAWWDKNTRHWYLKTETDVRNLMDALIKDRTEKEAKVEREVG
jgi:hypothetical protein